MELIVIAILAIGLIGLVGWVLTGGSAAIQSKALQLNSKQFLELAETRLKAEAALGEAQIRVSAEQIDRSISNLRDYVERVDRSRGESVASLEAVTAESRKTMESLSAATGKLTEVLSSGQSRGQWGERMAEDILRVAGFEEGVQYRKNSQVDEGTARPDFTFLLPQDRVLHMDVKFPLAQYMRFLEAPSEIEREADAKAFLRDVRARIKEVTTRDYIDLSSGTLDYVLLFIPNEGIYGFIHERDPGLLDGALQQHVVLCSPFTLFAVLAVIRQAIDNFHLTQRTDEILGALGGFNQEWAKYKKSTDAVARSLQRTQNAFGELTGRRRRALDRQVGKVETMRLEAGLDAEVIDEPLDILSSSNEALDEGDFKTIEDEESST